MFEAVMMSVVADLLTTVIGEYLRERLLPGKVRFDFIFKDKFGKRIAIELKSTTPSNKTIRKIAHLVEKVGNEIDRFILLTPDPPADRKIEEFRRIFQKLSIESTWAGINELPSLLGVTEPINLKSSETIDDLQVAAFISSIYKKPPIGTEPEVGELRNTIEFAKEELEKIPWEFRQLARQFSFKHINDFLREDKPLDKLLKVGQQVKDITIVLSDIKDFSPLVKSARPYDVKEIMSRYYRQARELVWEHGGVLGNFVGDAVLAVFGYPTRDPYASVNAIRFSADLIIQGNQVLYDLCDTMDEVIETGTRIGVTTGDVSVLEIGISGIEISFVGNIINLAARLQKSCDINGVLIAHRTKRVLLEVARDFTQSLHLEERILEPEEVKGQGKHIRAWQIPPVVIPAISSAGSLTQAS